MLTAEIKGSGYDSTADTASPAADEDPISPGNIFVDIALTALQIAAVIALAAR